MCGSEECCGDMYRGAPQIVGSGTAVSVRVSEVKVTATTPTEPRRANDFHRLPPVWRSVSGDVALRLPSFCELSQGSIVEHPRVVRRAASNDVRSHLCGLLLIGPFVVALLVIRDGGREASRALPWG